MKEEETYVHLRSLEETLEHISKTVAKKLFISTGILEAMKQRDDPR